MAYTLLVNPGSSSKKYSIVHNDTVISSSRFERTAASFDLCIEQNGQQQKCEGITGTQFNVALKQVLDNALRSKLISNLQDITLVGVRVVAPGTYFQKHQIVDDVFIHRLREREPAAPLHIPHTLAEIELLRVELPHVKIVAVSDSAFHKTLPAQARNYSIETHDTSEHDIHRFGYHGISVASLVPRIKSVLGDLPEKTIVAHIGSGVSMSALKNGICVDTTMGFSPDSGMIMGTRAGDLDAGALLELMRVKNMKSFDTLSYIQNRGGLKGLCGESDFRLLLERVAHKDESAETALQHFVYRFQKQLGAFSITLGGLDALILTATASERSAVLRHFLLQNLSWFGITLDEVRNENLVTVDGVISTHDSTVTVAVIRTQELTEILNVVNSFAV